MDTNNKPENQGLVHGEVMPNQEVQSGYNQQPGMNPMGQMDQGYNQQPGMNMGQMDQGYNQQPGMNPMGQMDQGYNQQPGMNMGQNPQGYNQQPGMNPMGQNPQGYNQQPGMNPMGQNPQGYNQQPGMNPMGQNPQGYNQQPGMNPMGQMDQGYNQQPGMNMGMNQMDVMMNQAPVVQGSTELASEFSEQAMNEYKARLRMLPEVQQLTNQIEVQNPNSIILFGQKASEGISKVSDELLYSIRSVKSEEAGEMLVALTKIMDKFDVEELENAKMGKNTLASKLFKNVGNTIAKMFQKYDTMGYEVDQVYQLLKKYEVDIKESNVNLKKLYNENVAFYHELERYIVAGEMAIDELDRYIYQTQMNQAITEEERNMTIQKLEICKEMLAQRIYDLQIAESVAMQSAPMIQTTQLSNFNLMRKINSSFILTLPIFKQCLIQAIMLKRQEIQAKSIQQLDDKTNELLVRNAQRTASQSVTIAKMASGSSIQIDKLRQSYDTIMKGIEETKAIQQQNAEERKQNSLELERMKQDMRKRALSE
ncbi:MAG: toxic anion resistance protein [Culicoidibacterales bacterium]